MLTQTIKIQRVWRRYRQLGLLDLGSHFEEGLSHDLLSFKPFMINVVGTIDSKRADLYTQWIRRLLMLAGSPDSKAFLSNQSNYLMCWLVQSHQGRFFGNNTLVTAADLLISTLRDCAIGYFGNINDLPRLMTEFTQAFDAWSSNSQWDFLMRLRYDIIDHYCKGSLRPAGVRSDSLVKFNRFHIMYRAMAPQAPGIFSLDAIKAVNLAKKSRFSSVEKSISRGRILHELLMADRQDFHIPLENSFPELVAVHQPSFRNDLRCILLSFVDGGEYVEMVADTFIRLERSSMADFARSLYEFIVYLFSSVTDLPEMQMVLSEWEAKKDTQPLEVVVYAVRVVRNLLENKTLDIVRQMLPSDFDFDSNALGGTLYLAMKVDKSKRTGAWIASSLESRPVNEVSALCIGNPYAMLEFFDTAVMGLVTDFSKDYLTEEAIPEFLYRDMSRLVAIRLELSLVSVDPKILLEFVNSRKWMGSRPLPPSLVEVVGKLRKILYLNRYVHADSIRPLIGNLAREEMTLRSVRAL